jgi:rubrerythrin
MDISKYDTKTLLLAAIKSEVEANRAYSDVAARVNNAFLKERLEFLASEEEKHRKSLENIYRIHFGSEKIELPEKTDVPLPEIEVGDENEPISLVLEGAMNAEKASEEFYAKLAERFEDEKVRDLMEVLAGMENMHYLILKAERENALKFEKYDAVWPMMHAGP